jgi:hypothetical protein
MKAGRTIGTLSILWVKIPRIEMKRPAAAIGFALSAVLVWCVLWIVAVLVQAIFAKPQPPKHRVTWLVFK